MIFADKIEKLKYDLDDNIDELYDSIECSQKSCMKHVDVPKDQLITMQEIVRMNAICDQRILALEEHKKAC